MEFVTVRAIKADSGEWELDVLGIPFGDESNRDSDGEFFTARTKLHEDKFPHAPAVYYHGFGDNNRPSASPAYIGRTVAAERRNDGVWYRVVLNKASELAKRVWEAAQRGTAFASSGSVAHLVRKATSGEILEWPVAELSIFDTDNGKRPANRYAVALPVLKAVYDEAGLILPENIDADDTDTPEDEATGGASAAAQNATSADDVDTATDDAVTLQQETSIMSEDMQTQVAEAVAAALTAEREAEAKRRDAEAAKQAEIEAAVKAAKDEAAAEIQRIKDEAAADRRLPAGEGAPYVSQFGNIAKYDGMEVADMAVLFAISDAARKSNRGGGPTENLRRAMAVRLADSEETRDPDYVESRKAMKMAGMSMKANELNQSTLANYGDEWIGVTYSSQLWDKIRLDTPIVSKIPTVVVPQGSESIVIPVASADPTFYKVAQASAQASNTLGDVTNTIYTSKLGTTNQTLTVSKLGAAAIYTGELEEDSLIPWAAQLRQQLTRAAAEVLEHIVIDGDTDTTGTTNINDIAGTPAGTEAFLLMNGFRKLALVTNTANSRDGGALAVEDFLETVKLMGIGGQNGYDRRAVSMIVDMHTYWKALQLTEMKSLDYVPQSTVAGQTMLTPWGYEVIGSPNMHKASNDATYGLKANANGKIDLDTASNNTKGAIVAVRWDQWRFGYKRQMSFEIERFPRADATSIVVTMRVGMVNRDTDASAISYNITV